jgi:hypothetical protein
LAHWGMRKLSATALWMAAGVLVALAAPGWAATVTPTPSPSPSASGTPKPSPSPVFPPAAPNRTAGLTREEFDALNVGKGVEGAPWHKEAWTAAEVATGWTRYSTKYDHQLIVYQRVDRLSWFEFKAFNAYRSVPKKVLTNAFQAYKGGAHQLVELQGRIAGRVPNLAFTQFRDINERLNQSYTLDQISAAWNKYQRGASHNMLWQIEDENRTNDDL